MPNKKRQPAKKKVEQAAVAPAVVPVKKEEPSSPSLLAKLSAKVKGLLNRKTKEVVANDATGKDVAKLEKNIKVRSTVDRLSMLLFGVSVVFLTLCTVLSYMWLGNTRYSAEIQLLIDNASQQRRDNAHSAALPVLNKGNHGALLGPEVQPAAGADRANPFAK